MIEAFFLVIAFSLACILLLGGWLLSIAAIALYAYINGRNVRATIQPLLEEW